MPPRLVRTRAAGVFRGLFCSATRSHSNGSNGCDICRRGDRSVKRRTSSPPPRWRFCLARINRRGLAEHLRDIAMQLFSPALVVALINEKRGKPVGYLNPVVYGLPKNAGAFHEIFKGTNGAYDAHPGWDACTGLGSRMGRG